MWEEYQGKVIFVTGASGFLGTALVYRLVTKAPVKHIYLLCRGGLADLREKWSQWLPSDTVDAMCDENRVTVLKGDLVQKDLGLGLETIKVLADRVNIVIHSASSINLRSGLADVSSTVVDASERLALLALHWHRLNDFVYVSTAFCNTHLGGVKVEETIHPLCPDGSDTIDDERIAIRESKVPEILWDHGSANDSTAHDNTHIGDANVPNKRNNIDKKRDAIRQSSNTEVPGFYWPYAYAKNLTERLLDRIFQGTDTRLLIVRPSIIGPSQCFPYHQFCMPLSCPPLTATAGFCLTPSRAVRFASKLGDPKQEATFEEVPVDVVVDRLLLHIAMGTTGAVHAIGGAPVLFQQWWEQMLRLRRFPWKLKPTWINPDISSDPLHPIAQLMKVIGMSFDFSQEKTMALCDEMGESELSDLQLSRQDVNDRYDLRAGRLQLWYCMDRFTRKDRRWKRKLAQALYGSWAYAERSGDSTIPVLN